MGAYKQDAPVGSLQCRGWRATVCLALSGLRTRLIWEGQEIQERPGEVLQEGEGSWGKVHSDPWGVWPGVLPSPGLWIP